METLTFHFDRGTRPSSGQPQLVGVVSSGNLEVLIEPASLNGGCDIEVRTAAHGFGAIWQAVISDFHDRWQLADTRIAINDMGATPAVVSLRLDQAVETLLGGPPASAPTGGQP
ncbi:malonate decarboxylase delta subunit [Noviherbaspirillum humi]|uniref:Malonate decarboxylase acyl carrier protein n=1 Tax=Noviherbaspirillum humi TaxID=1688639 RepID=A0A239L186_9BURK|nr:malonate decarboxylase acyl carrier protein [Noviherbaspirillum humi]SNT23678.1 malonate decarboxylase delta subunit [Noviherbaspirillum humi]